MNKKKAIVNTLLGKIQARSTKLFEDVNKELWSFEQEKPTEKDYDIIVDGEEVSEDDDKEEVKALDIILDAPVNSSEKEVKEF